MGKLVLSASQLGEKCLRKLWYLSRGWVEEVGEELQRVFDIGKALEPVVVEWMRRDGFEVYYNEKGHADAPDFSIRVGKGEVQGRFDAVLLNEGVLVDIKTCGDVLFSRILEGDIPERYLVQVNVYFFGVKLFGDSVRGDIREVIRKVGIVGVHKATGKMEVVVMEPDLEVFTRAIEKAKRVFDAENPFVLESAGEIECQGCGFGKVCRGLERKND